MIQEPRTKNQELVGDMHAAVTVPLYSIRTLSLHLFQKCPGHALRCIGSRFSIPVYAALALLRLVKVYRLSSKMWEGGIR